jgi:uncharacterized protein (DUF1330 family)
MSAYLIVLARKIIDRSKMEEYWKSSPAALQGIDVRVMAAYTPFKVLEGDLPLEGVAIVEFPNLEEAAKRWYENPAYQELMRLRHAGMEAEIIVVEGGIVPVPDRFAHVKGVGS